MSEPLWAYLQYLVIGVWFFESLVALPSSVAGHGASARNRIYQLCKDVGIHSEQCAVVDVLVEHGIRAAAVMQLPLDYISRIREGTPPILVRSLKLQGRIDPQALVHGHPAVSALRRFRTEAKEVRAKESGLTSLELDEEQAAWEKVLLELPKRGARIKPVEKVSSFVPGCVRKEDVDPIFVINALNFSQIDRQVLD